MNRRAVVLVASLGSFVLLVVAGVLVSRAYIDESSELVAPTRTAVPVEVVEQLRLDYLAAIDEWPYPLPVEDALPEKPPTEFATQGGEVAASSRISIDAHGRLRI